MKSSRRWMVAVLAAGLVAASCGSDEPASSGTADGAAVVTDSAATERVDEKFPNIVDASAELVDGAWTFSVTVSSPYDSPERYADGWRILGPDGTEFGFRLLTHDHASEQPFTRTMPGVQIPDDVDVVTIEGRDQISGFGGETFELTLSAT